ncbi:MAG: hypothetical protein LC667_01185 [Thioalkalivibrio sp.]|nr:hypothetical protein [Thioalkalivibrio sp.]
MTDIENVRARIQVGKAAVGRLERYQAALQTEGALVADLVERAYEGVFDGLPERAARYLALDAIQAAIPEALAHLQNETRQARDELAVYGNPESAARQQAAGKRYETNLQAFEGDYRAIATSSDRDLLPKAARELFELARQASMVGHLRTRFEALRERPRGHELEVF